MLRTINAESIGVAHNLFGTTFGVGCRNLPPHKGKGPLKLLHGDIVNLANVEAPENQEDQLATFKEFIVAH